MEGAGERAIVILFSFDGKGVHGREGVKQNSGDGLESTRIKWTQNVFPNKSN